MNKFLQILIGVLIVSGCDNSNSMVSLLEKDLERIDVSLSSSISAKLDAIDINHFINPEKWGPTYNKTESFVSLYDSLLSVIYSKGFVASDVNRIISDFQEGVSSLNLQNERFELQLNQRISYWTERKASEVLSNSLAIELRLCIIEILDELIDQVEYGSISFNVIRPVIVESSNAVSVGDKYTAKIGIQAYDSTNTPRIRVNGAYLEIKDGYGIYEAISNNPGVKEYKGDIILELYGMVITTSFEECYLVK